MDIKYLNRTVDADLIEWKNDERRKPLHTHRAVRCSIAKTHWTN